MGAQCTAAFSSFKLPNLKQKNKYISLQNQKQINSQQFNQFCRFIFGNNQEVIKQKQSLLLNLYKLEKGKQFIDPKFQVKGQRLSKMYDYKKKNIKLYNQQNKHLSPIFQQSNVQFSYLSAVLYFLSKRKQFLRKRIILNPQINQKQTYGFRLFCNGEDHIVIIDDILPCYQDKFLYSSIQGKQLWPCLLQKAWCKQIGSYQQARGLSPQECFQQITSIPAYSYQIQSSKIDTLQTMENLLSVGYWLCCVAKKQLGILKPSQVFAIQEVKISDHNQQIVLLSLFTDFKYPSFNKQSPGKLKINYNKFFELFDFLIVGFYKQSYFPTSIKFKAEKREEKFFQLNIDQAQQISIRFTQFYSGYLDDAQKSNYDYSPLTIFQLYDPQGVLLNFCQGCDRMHSGVHSTYFTNKIFHYLKSGTYYLRLQVDWQYPQYIKQGNIVIYSSYNNVRIQSLEDMHNLQKNIKKVHGKSLGLPNTVIIPCDTDQYQLRYLQKKNNVLISVENKSKQDLIRLQLDFSLSSNFRVKYEKLQSNKKVILNLGPKQIKYLQVLPEQIKKQYKIQPFSVKRLPIIQH